MKKIRILTVSISFFVIGTLYGQQPPRSRTQPAANSPASAIEASPTGSTGYAAVAAHSVVPRLIKFNGTLGDLTSKPIAETVDVTFALYAEEAGGGPLWFETQTVQADSHGRYTVLLGAMSPAGVPVDLFTSGEAHWLGVMVQGLPEQSRVLLVSVPYALKAGDAETLGGKPASAFVLSSNEAPDMAAHTAMAVGSLSELVQADATTSAGGRVTPQGVTTTTTQYYIPMFADNNGALTNSVMYQYGSRIGVGTTTPAYPLDVNGFVFAIGPTSALPGAGGPIGQ